jgi:4-amino-4-deoxy-L-arabinose transferase-like glycosyltransferase
MQPFVLSEKSRKLLGWSLLFMLVVRLIASALIPLTDTTEARYAEIARKMLETGDWITPQHDYGVPFWAKPPLSTWLSAGSMKLFGVNEFAARLPSLLLGVAMLALVWSWVAPRRGRDFALAVTAILASMVLFFMASGAVMTDSSLAFGTTLTMIAFWQALHSPQKYWGYLFFVGLGIGLLAKGPLVGVLTFLPILPWLALRKNWRDAWQRLPWISGSVLMLIIAVPWYLIAEHKTPGFLAYFILGEHFGRFLNSGWSGDKYGHAHAEPLGMIWVYWFDAAFPWSFVVIVGAVKRARQWRRQSRKEGFRDEGRGEDSGLISYLVLWSFTSMVFFTAAHNIIWSYPLPALSAFAVLVVELWMRWRGASPTGAAVDIIPRIAIPNIVGTMSPRLLAATFATPLGILLLTAIYTDDQQVILKSSQRNTAQFYMQTRPADDSGLYYFRRRYYSGEFYSAGKAQIVTLEDIERLHRNNSVDFLVVKSEDLQNWPAPQRAYFKTVGVFGESIVLEEAAPPATALKKTAPAETKPLQLSSH